MKSYGRKLSCSVLRDVNRQQHYVGPILLVVLNFFTFESNREFKACFSEACFSPSPRGKCPCEHHTRLSGAKSSICVILATLTRPSSATCTGHTYRQARPWRSVYCHELASTKLHFGCPEPSRRVNFAPILRMRDHHGVTSPSFFRLG